MNSILFDSIELRNTTYIPRFVKHESATERELNILNLARDDGGVLVNDRRGVKRIQLQGVLTATTTALLETAIDNFKELLSRQAKNLDIEWAGGTRRYVATCASHNFDRDFFHLLFVPWTAEFVVVSGVGSDTTITAEKHAVSVNANPYTWSSTFAGSSKPKPIVTLEFGAGHTNPRGIQLKNTTNGQKIIYNKPSALVSGDTIIIDFEQKKLTLEGVEKPFYGVFPDLIIGANTFELTIGEILDQYSDPTGWSSELSVWGANLFEAHSFIVPNTDQSYKRIGIYCEKTGTPTVGLVVEIQTDDGGKPSGTKVNANSYGTISKDDVTTDPAWVYCNLIANITLNANTVYWLVLKSTGADVSNYYEIPYVDGSLYNYNKGNASRTTDGGSTWVNDPDANIGFKLMYGGNKDGSLGTITLDVDYYKKWI